MDFKNEGILKLNNNGRYEVNGFEFSCGTPFEIELNGVFVPTSMEFSDGCQFGYYATGLIGLRLQGKKVRF